MDNLWRQWECTVENAPDKPVLRDAGAKSWVCAQELLVRAEKLAKQWQRLDLEGSTVVFCLPNGSEWLQVFLALQKLGAAALAVDPATSPGIVLEQANQLHANFIHEGGRLTPLGSKERRETPLCLGKLTSGSTGMPKALLFRPCEMRADGENIIRTMGIRADDINYAMIPFGHSYGLGNLVMPLILQGTAIACGSDPLPRLAAAGMERTGATVAPSVPAFFRALARTDLEKDPIPRLRLFISAGAPLSQEVAHQFEERFGRRVHNFYGSSETGGIAYDRDGSLTLAGEGVGQPMDGVSVWTTDEREIVVRSGAVFTIGNQEVQDNMGQWRTGDLGAISKTGALKIEGRRRPLAKVGGRRVDPLEIERLLRDIPGVTDAIVQVQVQASGDRLTAFVETSLQVEEVRHWLVQRLPTWKIPRKLIVMMAFPRDQRGKVSHAALGDLGRR